LPASFLCFGLFPLPLGEGEGEGLARERQKIFSSVL
jgi:hypothetical protein